MTGDRQGAGHNGIGKAHNFNKGNKGTYLDTRDHSVLITRDRSVLITILDIPSHYKHANYTKTTVYRHSMNCIKTETNMTFP